MNIEEKKRWYLELNVVKFLVSRQINNINNWFMEDFKIRGIVPSVYGCQKCQTMIVREEEVEIIVGSSPLCNGCLGNITITKKMVNDYIDKHNLG